MSKNTNRPAPGALLRETPIVAVLRAKHASEYAPVIDALVAGGVTSIELTLSTAGVFEELPVLRGRYGANADIGVGTITTVEDAEAAIAGGAGFIVTPITDPQIVATAVAAGIPVYPGGMTPTELFAGWKAGATAVKIFPASQVGPGFLKDLRGPFPDIQAVPSGGVDVAEAVEWIRAGALAVSVGGPLLGDAFKGGDLAELTVRAKALVNAVAEAKDGVKV
ncbi:bifunctional 4-hydroxy-2-oxoglutarate aldolase/2-dehydro-3-deoxy-phosphogluconate aldolase [Paeniglutamicibacter terrestris]|uniref:Bifunctional 4-hydroxy-2-oxoglutarate aldolase/2-dehydro-3-deoxy-phosphogluconate aldolase n=1 Tax=Paeniglutamicibacter terrestris TaxID=2723403 RepID=A0ABX1G0X6_9MICC|nr:bifunctional 4-hydroxy-2-oxoglutarate aldolase/2-dehydro-3-deoxy-phosphogluconate aldolase [Paeniglutamicibacter terrestris]NKG19896.1 bifunctional 4-hydroxy-2-oxoglutarate aldolase/2-dehydro-3-deoxy-phosphogluconate aldolase [Paeniglutamicibacter terrestris]